MFMFQDDKDKLKHDLSVLRRSINDLHSALQRQIDVLTQRLDSLTHPHGAKKDGSPRAKPGRKPKGVQA
jgi:hypothetical protein